MDLPKRGIDRFHIFKFSFFARMKEELVRYAAWTIWCEYEAIKLIKAVSFIQMMLVSFIFWGPLVETLNHHPNTLVNSTGLAVLFVSVGLLTWFILIQLTITAWRRSKYKQLDTDRFISSLFLAVSVSFIVVSLIWLTSPMAPMIVQQVEGAKIVEDLRVYVNLFQRNVSDYAALCMLRVLAGTCVLTQIFWALGHLFQCGDRNLHISFPSLNVIEQMRERSSFSIETVDSIIQYISARNATDNYNKLHDMQAKINEQLIDVEKTMPLLSTIDSDDDDREASV